MLAGEGADVCHFVLGEPVIAWHPMVVLVDLAETLDPVLVLAAGDANPGQEAGDRDVGFVAPGADEIDELVASVVGDPAPGQSSPRLFFSSVCASMSSAMTSFLRASLAWSCWIFWSLASSTALALRPLSKARWAFSKSRRCH